MSRTRHVHPTCEEYDSVTHLLDCIWNDIEKGILEIYQNREAISTKRCMELYTMAYSYCCGLNPKARQLTNHFGAVPVGKKMYNNLRTFYDVYLRNQISHFKLIDGELLLFEYVKTWNEYRLSSAMVENVFSYLNTNWVRRKLAEGKSDIQNAYNMAIFAWKYKFFDELKKTITTSIIHQIKRERDGDFVSQQLLHNVIASYVQLGENFFIQSVDGDDNYADEDDENSFYLPIYKKDFEYEFIEKTKEFYRNESMMILEHISVTEYMTHVEQRLRQEENRISAYLHESTAKILMQTCEKELIEAHIPAFSEEFQTLLEMDDYFHLRQMYLLIARLPSNLEVFKQNFQDYVIREGGKAIRCEKELTEGQIPIKFVESVITIYYKLIELVVKTFDRNKEFNEALDKAFIKFVNKMTRAPEFLAIYIDLLIRVQFHNEDELDRHFKNSIRVFKYLEEKDVFQNFYWKLLAKRLINQSSSSIYAETSLILKLNEQCGTDFTTKWSRMCQDIDVSKDLNNDFKNHLQNANISLFTDLSVIILSAGSWPFSSADNYCSLPSEMEKSIHIFNEFYHKLYSGRKLLWLTSLSRGDLIANCFAKKYLLHVSALQMSVLLQFNDGLSFTVQQLVDNTQIELDNMFQVIEMLMNAKLTICSQSANDLKTNSIVRLNCNFKNKKHRINIQQPLKTLTKVERKSTEKHIEEDRKYLIQAALVRIMKTHKTLSHTQLVTEVLNQLSSRFKPKIPMVKKCIEILIEKEYFELSEGHKDIYNYLA